jgi:DNA-binding NtrC family response regulator
MRRQSVSDKKRILMVEDDELFRRSTARILRDTYQVDLAGSVPEALQSLKACGPDLIMLDMMLPGQSGMELLRHLKERPARPPVIVLTAVDRVATVVEAIREGAIDFLTKPLRYEELLLSIEKALHASEIRSEVEQRRNLQLDNNRQFQILGTSVAIERVRRDITKVGPTDATVLVNGETGTGKELVARGIHAASSRASGPFVAINCGAVPKDLFESEFFGHKKGAFTGADSPAVGKLRLAHKGTLLLDEIGELPLSAQVKLLRVLEEQQFYPVGGEDLVTVDTRVVACTHRDLEEMVEEGTFREDLYFRLNVYQIDLPPLRGRSEDILRLAHNFLEIFNRKFQKEFRDFTTRARDLLSEHPWKGNVRELRNVIERVVLAEDGKAISEEHLDMLRRGTRRRDSWSSLHLPEDGIDFEEVEKHLLTQALERTGGNKSRAARLLRLSPPTFFYRLEKYNISEVIRNK